MFKRMKAISIYLSILFVCGFAVNDSQQKVKCPKGFELFQNHCFHISEKAGSRESATILCKQMNGYQTWIDGDKKEEIVKDYLKANIKQVNRRLPFVWLPPINNLNNLYIWKDSHKTATQYLKKHGYNSKNMQQSDKLNFYMNVFAYVFHCSSKCWDLHAFCEVEPETVKREENTSENCPRGFDAYNNYCFYISKSEGNYKFAREVCKRIGGHQTAIESYDKNKTVISYLKANRDRITSKNKSVWLPRVIFRKYRYRWLDSGKSAASFAWRTKIPPSLFTRRQKRRLFWLTDKEQAKTCSKHHCPKSHAFCETESLPVKNCMQRNNPHKSNQHGKLPLQGDEKCPYQFDKYGHYCFYIGGKKLTIRQAKETCKRLGGRPVDISDAAKEESTNSYLLVNRERFTRPGQMVWLSTIVADGNQVTWQSSGKSALPFLGYTKIKLRRKAYYEREVYMDFRGVGRQMLSGHYVGFCQGECRRRRFQPFCEADLIPGHGKTSNHTKKST